MMRASVQEILLSLIVDRIIKHLLTSHRYFSKWRCFGFNIKENENLGV